MTIKINPKRASITCVHVDPVEMAPLALVEVVEVGAAEETIAVAAARPESPNG